MATSLRSSHLRGAACAYAGRRARRGSPAPAIHRIQDPETRMSAVTDPGTEVEGVALLCEGVDGCERVLTPQALAFVAGLHRRFNATRLELLAARDERQARLEAGELPTFLASTQRVRDDDWRVGPTPADLEDRRVEITGPVEAKMMINALNSGASCFMADFEDALSPTWRNVVEGQDALMGAVRRTLEFTSPEGKEY